MNASGTPVAEDAPARGPRLAAAVLLALASASLGVPCAAAPRAAAAPLPSSGAPVVLAPGHAASGRAIDAPGPGGGSEGAGVARTARRRAIRERAASPIPAAFFGMSAWNPGSYPGVAIGTLGHGYLAWAWVEPSRGSFDFSLYDGFLAEARQHGLVDPVTNTADMAITLGMTPAWAVADQSSCSPAAGGMVQCTAPPDDIQDWKDFLAALVRHYDGVDRPHVRYYELWNEMNFTLYWTGTVAQMVALARAAFPIVHRDPYSMLLTPSMGGGPPDAAAQLCPYTWMTNYLQAGGARYADGGAFHGYLAVEGTDPFPMPEEDSTSACASQPQRCYGSIVTKAARMRAVFDENGLVGKPMFQTEGSWGKANVADADTQVAWLARWLILQAGLRDRLDLRLASWFAWAKPAFGWGNVASADGTPTAAGVAYEQVYRWLVGATMSRPCASTSDGTWTCPLSRPGGYGALIVWSTRGSGTYTPADSYAVVRDLAGGTADVTPGALVAIGARPVLLESESAP